MAKTITTNRTIYDECAIKAAFKTTCTIIDLHKEYPNSFPESNSTEAKYAIVSDLSVEELTTVEDLKRFEPYVVISSEMYDVIKESNRNNERERKRNALYHDVFAIDDERVSTQLISPDTIAESNYTYEHILSEIRLLPGVQGRRLYQRCVLGLSVVEIAKRDGVSTYTVYESLRKAKDTIHKVFITEGVVA